MNTPDTPQTGADLLVRRLRAHGVRLVFGYPGGQLTPVYDALAREPALRHILARHEQAAGFMADGHARATGTPGVCLAVCGPGVYNAATPLATAYTDSVPFLLISGQVASAGRGVRSGYYHENDQLSACATMTKWRARAGTVDEIVPALDRAFAEMTTGRPGPVLLEIPVDVQRTPCRDARSAPVPTAGAPPAPASAEVEALARLLLRWRRPLLLVGGGVVTAGAEALVAELSRRLGAPVHHTFMGKTAMAPDHALNAGLPWSRATSDLSDMGQFMSPLFAEADGLLAIGCRFSQACTGSWVMTRPPALAQIDIDAEELGRHYALDLGICADAGATLRALLDAMSPSPREPWTAPARPSGPFPLGGLDLVGALRRALPRDAIVVADVTRLGYMLVAGFPLHEPRCLLHPAGFVPMGYGLPAALGAKSALPGRTVVAVLGDGCFQMCGFELATAVQEKLPVVVIVVNDGSLTLIKAIQQRRYEGRYLGVDLLNPDFGQLGKAFGVAHWRTEDDVNFERAVREAVASNAPALVEVCVG